MRIVCRSGDLVERQRSIGAGNAIATVLKLDIILGSFKQVRREAPTLGYDLVSRLCQRRTAHRNRAGAKRTPTIDANFCRFEKPGTTAARPGQPRNPCFDSAPGCASARVRANMLGKSPVS